MDEYFRRFARRLGEYVMDNFVLPWLREHGNVTSYRAQVVSVDSTARTMVVQRPFDTPVTLPYTDGASSLAVGSQCVVFVLGDSSNAVVVSDGRLSTL